MATPVQPTSYKPEYCELGHNYCLLDVTNEELGGFFGVTRRTVDNWITTHPDFAKAVHDGRAVADAVIARSLFSRAKGFSHEVTRKTLCERPYTGAKETNFQSKELQHGQQSVRSHLSPGDPAPILSVYAVRKNYVIGSLMLRC